MMKCLLHGTFLYIYHSMCSQAEREINTTLMPKQANKCFTQIVVHAFHQLNLMSIENKNLHKNG